MNDNHKKTLSFPFLSITDFFILNETHGSNKTTFKLKKKINVFFIKQFCSAILVNSHYKKRTCTLKKLFPLSNFLL